MVKCYFTKSYANVLILKNVIHFLYIYIYIYTYINTQLRHFLTSTLFSCITFNQLQTCELSVIIFFFFFLVFSLNIYFFINIIVLVINNQFSLSFKLIKTLYITFFKKRHLHTYIHTYIHTHTHTHTHTYIYIYMYVYI